VTHSEVKKVLVLCHEANIKKEFTVNRSEPGTQLVASSGITSPVASSVHHSSSPNAPIETGPHDTIP